MIRRKLPVVSQTLTQLNDRHPWNHNEAFHPWILSRLPHRREHAIDIGCGRGELVAALADHFTQAEGTDINADMRDQARRRCAGLQNVTITGRNLIDLPPEVDLISMVAVLHHLAHDPSELEATLRMIATKLSPGGRFLCVGLAYPHSPQDYLWEAGSVVTNPLIGYVRHPWKAATPRHDTRGGAPTMPVRDPSITFTQIRHATVHTMPGATVKHHLGFRHTIQWSKPQNPPAPRLHSIPTRT